MKLHHMSETAGDVSLLGLPSGPRVNPRSFDPARIGGTPWPRGLRRAMIGILSGAGSLAFMSISLLVLDLATR